jgi:hypothetical protein
MNSIVDLILQDEEICENAFQYAYEITGIQIEDKRCIEYYNRKGKEEKEVDIPDTPDGYANAGSLLLHLLLNPLKDNGKEKQTENKEEFYIALIQYYICFHHKKFDDNPLSFLAMGNNFLANLISKSGEVFAQKRKLNSSYCLSKLGEEYDLLYWSKCLLTAKKDQKN